MTDDRWARVEALFHAALEQPAPARAAWIDARTDLDAAIRAEARRLVGAHDAEPGFLDEPPPLPTDDAPPPRIGRYELLEVLGEGGMGVVHLARQEQPDRLVALKLIRPGFVTDEAIRRLEVEAEILGRLRHPGIAQIHEAGTALVHGRPQPYFAMERIEGAPITRFADETDLDRTARLRLFAEVCEAVEAAHRKGVVHRDLKPANVLVSADRRPHVLDFGVARLADADARLATLTDRGRIVGTLPYLAPEHLAGRGDAGDPRADVYALGVILYELLGGRRPHALEDSTLPEAIRTAAERDAPPLGSIDRGLRGDLETIARTALARDPSRRYADAGALARDVRAYLEHRPVGARAPSAAYRASRFARRHRIALAALLIIVIMGAGGGSLLLAQSLRASRTAARMKAIDEVVAEVLEVLEDPRGLHAPELADRLDRVVVELDAIEAPRPLAEAALRETLGDGYERLGRHDQAGVQYERSALLREAALGRGAPETLDALNGVAIVWLRSPGENDVEALLREVAAGRRAVLGRDHRKTLKSHNDLGQYLIGKGRTEEGEAMLQATLEGQREHIGDDHLDTLTTMQNLSRHYARTGREEEAIALAVEALGHYERQYGRSQPRTLMAAGTLGRLLSKQGRAGEAEPLYERYADGLEEELGRGHRDAAVARANQGTFLLGIDRTDEGLAAWARAAEGVLAAHGPHDVLALRLQIGLGQRLITAGRFDEAEPILLDALSGAESGQPGMLPRALRNVERLYRKWGRDEDAARYRARIEGNS